jgi:hypothetical protein
VNSTNEEKRVLKNATQHSLFHALSRARTMMLCGLLVSPLLVAAAKPALAADAPGLTGRWSVHNKIAGNESDQLCTWTQTEKVLSGSCKSDQSTVEVTGSVDAKKLTWQYKSEYNGTPLTLIYTATVDDPAKITGAVEVQPFGVTGEFTAVPAPAETPATPATPTKQGAVEAH